MHFASPWYFGLLLILPVYWYFICSKKNKKTAIQIPVLADLLEAQNHSWLKYWLFMQHLLVSLLIILFAITLARPQTSYEKQEMSKKGIDIIIALDVSESMLAEDLEPNRLESAKDSVNQFISNLENDRLGIVVFAGQAFTQSPLTFDYNILTEYLTQISTKSINQRINGLGGTAIGDAILATVNRFKKSTDRSKVLILITDGDANVGVDPIIAAKKASNGNIKIYTIGIGKEGGAPLPVRDEQGQKVFNNIGEQEYYRNPNGSIFMATFNETALKEIANIGSGKYFRAGDNESFKQVLKEINQLEKREITTSVNTEYQENFIMFLYALLGVFTLYIISISVKVVLK